MLDLILLLIVVSVSALLYYSQVYAPRKLHYKLNEEFSKKQWKVYSHPFTPFKFALHESYRAGAKKAMDGFYFQKYTASNYDLTLANLASREFIFIQHPTLIKEFYKLDSETTMRKEKFFTESIFRLVGEGLTYSEGFIWKEKRKVMSKFLNFEFLKRKNPEILKFTQRQFNNFFAKNQVQGLEGKQNAPQGYLLEILENAPAQYINELYFGGSKMKFEIQQFDGVLMPTYINQIIKSLNTYANDPLPKLLGFLGIKLSKFGLRKKDREVDAKIKRFRGSVGSFFKTRIKEIKEEIGDQMPKREPKDLTQAFYFNLVSEKLKMSEQEFIDGLICDYLDMMQAFAENIGLTSLMLVYYVYKSPETKNRLVKELESEFKVLNIENVEKLKELKYLECCVTEVLRLYQSVSGIFPRELLTDIELDGVRIKKGSVVSVPMYEVHYRDILYKDAKEFKPERWLDEKGEIIRTDFSTFVTFGGGARACIGKHVALAQIRIIAAYFFLNFEAEFQTLDIEMLKDAENVYEPRPIKMKLRKKNQ